MNKEQISFQMELKKIRVKYKQKMNENSSFLEKMKVMKHI